MSDKTTAQIPKYRLHTPTGRGVVRLNGRDIYYRERQTLNMSTLRHSPRSRRGSSP
jgi:hypothetical protein